MSSEFETQGTIDPTAGESAGAEGQTQQGTPAPQAPAGRTFTDADMAAARRSWEADSRKREQTLRQELEQRFVPREQPKTADPWSEFDPRVAAALQAAIDAKLTPFQQFQKQSQERQEDLDFRNEESEVRSKYPDYSKNRVAILEFAVQNGIGNPDAAYRAWKFDELSKLDPAAIGKTAVAEYLKKKTAQSGQTPAVEGRGGGAPSSKQAFKSREDMDEAALAMIQAAND